jgi:hypothetical protein
MNYSDLNQELKEEIFANNLAFTRACQFLAKTTGMTAESWAKMLAMAASEEVNSLPDEVINNFIKHVEDTRERVRTETGGISTIGAWEMKL